jgi:hypothetical protein
MGIVLDDSRTRRSLYRNFKKTCNKMNNHKTYDYHYNIEEEIRILEREENRLSKQLRAVTMELKRLREKRNR